MYTPSTHEKANLFSHEDTIVFTHLFFSYYFSRMKDLSRKYGGFDIAGRDAGTPRDALAIYEARQNELPGYRVEAGAYEDVSSEG
jgi:hypothetical protein